MEAMMQSQHLLFSLFSFFFPGRREGWRWDKEGRSEEREEVVESRGLF